MTIASRIVTASLCGFLAWMPAAWAGFLLGDDTLDAPDDLTVIQEGYTVYEFLDLSVTNGMSAASAIAAYGARGFHWAKLAELSYLYDALGITIPSEVISGLGTTINLAALAVDTDAARTFTDHLGVTHGDAALGSFLIPLPNGFVRNGYGCISQSTCSPAAFVVAESVSLGPPGIGVYLVRVPEPASASLIVLALAILATTRARSRVPHPDSCST